MTAGKPRLLLGQIAAAHGVRGAVLIKSFTADPKDIAAYGPLADEDGRRSFKITVERVTPKGVVGRIEGVSDRTAAEKLRGVRLYVPRERLPPSREGEYYHADLIGLAAIDAAGTAVGEVVSVANYGAGDVLEIRLAGAGGRTELLPMTEAFVHAVDLAAGRVVVSMPATAPDDNENDE